MIIEEPKVTIWCPAYNHELFIQKCLDSFLFQKTNFPIEIIVHDDASTDRTSEIIKNYKNRYPNLFLTIFQKENQFSKDPSHLIKTCFKVARRKYIALCEGDDYWTDPYKLQKQVDFLEMNPDYSLTCHNVEVVGNIHQTNYVKSVKDFYTAEDLASGEISIPALSVVFRNYMFVEQHFFLNTPIADFPLLLLISQNGKIKYFPEVMGARCVHEGGLWSSADKSAKLTALLTTVYFMIGNYNEEINNALIKYHLKLIANSIKEGNSIDLYPKEMIWIIEIMSYYSRFKTVLRNFGLFNMFKGILRNSKQ